MFWSLWSEVRIWRPDVLIQEMKSLIFAQEMSNYSSKRTIPNQTYHYIYIIRSTGITHNSGWLSSSNNLMFYNFFFGR